MSKSDNLIEIYKRTIAITTKSIGKSKKTEINFSDEGPSVFENKINLSLPKLKNINKDLNYLRGEADSLALKIRLHNIDIHKKYISGNNFVDKIFTAIEQSRCDAYGSKIFKGIKYNIDIKYSKDLKELEKENDENENIIKAFKYISYAEFTEKKFDGKYLFYKNLISKKLGKNYKKIMKSLSDNIEDQENFAKNTNLMLTNLELEGIVDEKKENNSIDDENSKKNEEENNNKNENNQLTKKQSDENDQSISEQYRMEDDNSDPGDQSTDNNLDYLKNISNSNNKFEYKVFSSENDEIINASDLCDNEELTKLRISLDKQVFSFQPLIVKIANKLQRKLLALQKRYWEFNIEEGFLDTSKLSRIIINPLNKLAYKIEKQIEFKDTVVTLLIDNSGSMRGRPITVAALCSDILARTLERCLIRTEILGFTTKAWKGGKSREKWLKVGKPANPGRLNDLRHIIYKNADAPWRRSKKNLGLLLKEGILKENVDGEALFWAYSRLKKRLEKRKILLVVSDGAPVDDSTLSVNPGNYLEKNLIEIIKKIENSDIELIAIGIGHDVSRYYKKAVTIMDVDQLGEVLLKELSNVFSQNYEKNKKLN
ncbi:MAG: Aerobic cobaltochelatase subunit CobT [Alphaproteobacteria bacterium MarineAlpha5_Bin9]|nr:MAG: Aerobic cobaltochelatase subunit CobT [Alphaproteobacteria bacterium MarineAlpha5_Bin9]|tara:strand:+ start:28009 stop:29805 length:1797 start_codon:yes stop_codon:yes gene_type:complete